MQHALEWSLAPFIGITLCALLLVWMGSKPRIRQFSVLLKPSHSQQPAGVLPIQSGQTIAEIAEWSKSFLSWQVWEGDRGSFTTKTTHEQVYAGISVKAECPHHVIT